MGKAVSVAAVKCHFMLHYLYFLFFCDHWTNSGTCLKFFEDCWWGRYWMFFYYRNISIIASVLGGCHLHVPTPLHLICFLLSASNVFPFLSALAFISTSLTIGSGFALMLQYSISNCRDFSNIQSINLWCPATPWDNFLVYPAKSLHDPIPLW